MSAEPHNTLYGVIGEFDSANALMAAARKIRAAGYKHFDAFAPFPVPGLSEAMGLHYGLKGWKHNLVPQLTLLGGLGGAAVAGCLAAAALAALQIRRLPLGAILREE